jgi:hypothetical protein
MEPIELIVIVQQKIVDGEFCRIKFEGNCMILSFLGKL